MESARKSDKNLVAHGGSGVWRGLVRVLFVGVVALASASLLPSPRPAAAASCEYVLGFRALHDLIPNVVGDCVVDEHHNPANGDGLQEATGVGGRGGLLAWRKADNWTAYTDGYRTWVNGPNGLQQRLNTERFTWEADSASFPAPRPATGQPAAPTAGLSVGSGAVVATDSLTLRGGPGAGNPAVATLASGTALKLLAGPTGPAGDTWWRVTDGSRAGYVAGAWLTPGTAPADSAFDIDLTLPFHRQRDPIWCDPADLQSWTEFATGKSLGDEVAIQQAFWSWELAHNAGFTVDQWDASPYAIASAAHQWRTDRGFNHFVYDDPTAATNMVAWLIANPSYREPSVATIWRGDHYILVRGFRATADPYKDPSAKVLGVYVMDPNFGRPSWLGEDRYIPIGEWIGTHLTPVTYRTPGAGVPGDVWQNKYVMVQRDWTSDGPTPAGRVNATPSSYGASR